MLLENNVSGNMNEMALVLTLIFFVGLIIIYGVIIYLIVHPKRKSLKMTYSAMLRSHTQNKSINYHTIGEDINLLIIQD